MLSKSMCCNENLYLFGRLPSVKYVAFSLCFPLLLPMGFTISNSSLYKCNNSKCPSFLTAHTDFKTSLLPILVSFLLLDTAWMKDKWPYVFFLHKHFQNFGNRDIIIFMITNCIWPRSNHVHLSAAVFIQFVDTVTFIPQTIIWVRTEDMLY